MAYRHALERTNETVCIFEAGQRVGGRIHSMRGQGPAKDLVVEAGAYRFAPNETCVNFKGFNYVRAHTHLCTARALNPHL